MFPPPLQTSYCLHLTAFYSTAGQAPSTFCFCTRVTGVRGCAESQGKGGRAGWEGQRGKAAGIRTIATSTLPAPRPPGISREARRVRADHPFCSASVQLPLECLSIARIASSPPTQITQGTALPRSLSISPWQVLTGGSKGPFTSSLLGRVRHADLRREKIWP